MQSYNTIYCNIPGLVTGDLFYLLCNILSYNALQCPPLNTDIKHKIMRYCAAPQRAAR